MIALDTNVLIDLLGDDPRADAAEAALRLALTNGPVVEIGRASCRERVSVLV